MSITDEIPDRLALRAIELANWAFGDSGTRFKLFGTPSTARDPFEVVSEAVEAVRVGDTHPGWGA